ncbi:MAG: SnoaL-like domain-containing protein [Deltaproteobacteria bacterium]|nr:SnoaL-like domain-containing protein [Deltaproteobacteria bacterium]
MKRRPLAVGSPLSAFVDAWVAGIRARDAAALSVLFDPEVLFCATKPEVLVGREAVRGYYEGVPEGLDAEARILVERSPAPGVEHGVVEVAFSAPGGLRLNGRLGVTLVRREAGWLVSQYHLASA